MVFRFVGRPLILSFVTIGKINISGVFSLKYDPRTAKPPFQYVNSFSAVAKP